MLDATHLSTQGQIVLPICFRKKLKLKEGTKFLVTLKNGNIILKPIKN